jgi:hypothetical protein
MSKELTSVVDTKGRICINKKDAYKFISKLLKVYDHIDCLKYMSMDEMADRYDQMFDNTGKQVYAVYLHENEHWLKTILMECFKRHSLTSDNT